MCLTKSHAITFADHLYNSNQYSLAAAEYERIVFFSPKNDTIHFKLLSSYARYGNYRTGIERAEMLYPATYSMPENIALQYAGMLFKNRSYTKADSFLHQPSALDTQSRLILQATSYGLADNYQKATATANQVNGSSNYIADYKVILESTSQFNFKKPYLAAALSAIVPGSGKVYTGDWKDGIVSFLMIATTGWQSYRAFNQSGSSSVRGWIFGSIATGFYIGNIYGSHKAARLHNKSLVNKTRTKIENLFDNSFKF